MAQIVTITRKELYRQVWSKAVLQLAKEYGLSDVGFAKLCKRNEIPRPPLGYWARKAAGQTPAISPLPRADEDWEIKITVYKQTIEDPGLRAEAEKELAQVTPEKPIIVPESLRGAHPLVAQTLRILEFAEKDAHGLIQPPAGGCLDVTVSKDALRRALRIMDALIKTFEARGYPVKVLVGKNERGTVVELMEVQVPFGIREIVAPKKEEAEDDGNVQGRYEFRHDRFKMRTVPSGQLCLEIEPHRGYYSTRRGLRRKWTDGERRPIEDSLNPFVASVINVATGMREAKLESERREHARKEAERLRAEREAARVAMLETIKQERAKVDKLSANATAWAQSRQLRAYIDAVRQDAVARGKDASEGSELGKWLLWAGQQADRLDPLTASPPSILDEEAKYRQPETQRYW